MRAFLIFAVSGFFTLAAPAAVHAQDYKTLLDIPDGATLVNLSATERVEVEQDLLVASLRYETKNRNPKALQDEINTVMEKALAASKKVSTVKVSTQQYHVYEYDENAGKRDLPPNKTWRGQQGLMVKGKNAADLLELVGTLQDLGLKVSGLNYTVSPELLEQTRESLLEAAMAKLTAKAERTAKSLGKKEVDFKQINVDMGGYYPQPAMYARDNMEMAVSAKMAAPVAAAGESEITLSVNAQALLR
jgi:predicted secreted protein